MLPFPGDLAFEMPNGLPAGQTDIKMIYDGPEPRELNGVDYVRLAAGGTALSAADPSNLAAPFPLGLVWVGRQDGWWAAPAQALR